jgi:hypothetical protein
VSDVQFGDVAFCAEVEYEIGKKASQLQARTKRSAITPLCGS